MYTIQSLNKLAKKKGISIVELEKVFSFVEASWETYLKKYYSGKAFFFYMWGDNLIPAIRVSVVSYFKGLELPFSCELNKVSDMQNIFKAYVENAQFNNTILLDLFIDTTIYESYQIHYRDRIFLIGR